MKLLRIDFGERSYDIYIEGGSIKRAAEIFGIADRKAFILTDSGVPSRYAKDIAESFSDARVFTVPSGEGSKSLSVFSKVCSEMLEAGIGRGDVCIACGGGVVGDLAGFAAATFMRGIDFYNVPTTLLSMVDSSVGGKTAVNHGGVKNVIGAFYQPRGVLIDKDVLSTLPRREFAGGMAEIIKMAATSDAELFSLLENSDIECLYGSGDESSEGYDADGEKNRAAKIVDKAKKSNEYQTHKTTRKIDIEDVILSALKIKKSVVESDEREGGYRKILNFGHTFGHAVEAATSMKRYNHGECVAIGMMAVTKGSVRYRLGDILKRFGLPISADVDISEAVKYISEDKKRDGTYIDAIIVDEIGNGRIARMPISDFISLVTEGTEDH